ncbi:hypothetical protein [Haloarcula litorea]|uniref:hypothetical protein n=1 Tax=Haloarcula litorea TaxID=3032579 RepID=UPI0023E789F8|nr:hypothetical protein [Halomicroarcula sp. GDY20]
MLQVSVGASPILWLLLLAVVVLAVPVALGVLVLLRRKTDRERRIDELERRVEELED